MNRILFIFFLFCFSAHAQDQGGIDELRPYVIEPAEYAINNRWYADCKTACINRANHNASCTVYRMYINKHSKQKDSVLEDVHYFGENGFTDSSWFAERKKPFKYTKVGGRAVKDMQCDCAEIHVAKGPPNGKLVDTKSATNMTSTRKFDANGHLQELVEMKKGFIKYNDSWDGNCNVKTEYEIDTAGNLLSETIYTSHTRFFGAPSREFHYVYDSHNNLISSTEYSASEGITQRRTFYYTTR